MKFLLPIATFMAFASFTAVPAAAASSYLLFTQNQTGACEVMANGVPVYSAPKGAPGSASTNMTLLAKQGENRVLYHCPPVSTPGETLLVTAVTKFTEPEVKEDIFRVHFEIGEVADEEGRYPFELKVLTLEGAALEPEKEAKGKIEPGKRIVYEPLAHRIEEKPGTAAGAFAFELIFPIEEFPVKELPWPGEVGKPLTPQDETALRQATEDYIGALAAKDTAALKTLLKAKSEHLAAATGQPLAVMEEGQAKFFGMYFQSPAFELIRPKPREITFVKVPGASVAEAVSDPRIEIRAGEQKLISQLFFAPDAEGRWRIVY